MKNKILTIILTLTVSFCAVLCIYASDDKNTTDKLLSELSFEEQVAFVENNGIDWPPFMDAENFRESLPRIIKKIEEDPDCTFAYNYCESLFFAEKVKKAVNEYYHRNQTGHSERSVLYTLVDSTVTTSWNNSFEGYNCYAYAIDYTSYGSPLSPAPLPFYYYPGCFSGITSYNLSKSIYQQALDVKSDLMSNSLGSHNCIIVTATRPTSLYSGQEAICIRKGPDDYHFMRKNSTYWYHKPDGTIPLKFNYTNPGYKVWTNEYVNYTGAHEPETNYNSSIYYILYRNAHGSLIYEWTGDHYHSGTKHYYQYGYRCNICGEYTSKVWMSIDCPGPPCTLIVQAIVPEEDAN